VLGSQRLEYDNRLYCRCDYRVCDSANPVFYLLKGEKMENHEVNEIGRWYDMPIFRTRMNEYITKWMLTNEYDVNNSDYDEHIYFNYASNKYYIYIESHTGGSWYIEIAPKGRAWLDEQNK
jgi:hypothetical protein